MYHHTKNEVSMSTASKVIAWTDRQTHTHTQTCTQTHRHTHRHTHTHRGSQTNRHDENITSTAYLGGNKVSMSTASKFIAWTERQTDRQTHTHTHTETMKTLPLSHTRAVKTRLAVYNSFHFTSRSGKIKACTVNSIPTSIWIAQCWTQIVFRLIHRDCRVTECTFLVDGAVRRSWLNLIIIPLIKCCHLYFILRVMIWERIELENKLRQQFFICRITFHFTEFQSVAIWKKKKFNFTKKCTNCWFFLQIIVCFW